MAQGEPGASRAAHPKGCSEAKDAEGSVSWSARNARRAGDETDLKALRRAARLARSQIEGGRSPGRVTKTGIRGRSVSEETKVSNTR